MNEQIFKLGWKSLILPAVSLAITSAQVIITDKRQKQLINQAVEDKFDQIITKTAEKILTPRPEIVGETAEFIENK